MRKLFDGLPDGVETELFDIFHRSSDRDLQVQRQRAPENRADLLYFGRWHALGTRHYPCSNKSYSWSPFNLGTKLDQLPKAQGVALHSGSLA